MITSHFDNPYCLQVLYKKNTGKKCPFLRYVQKLNKLLIPKATLSIYMYSHAAKKCETISRCHQTIHSLRTWYMKRVGYRSKKIIYLNNTVRIWRAGLHLSLRISRQIRPNYTDNIYNESTILKFIHGLTVTKWYLPCQY